MCIRTDADGAGTADLASRTLLVPKLVDRQVCVLVSVLIDQTPCLIIRFYFSPSLLHTHTRTLSRVYKATICITNA